MKRIVISLPEYLISEIDCLAEAENINRSALVREAMMLHIAERKRQLMREQMKKGYVEMAKINLALAIEQYKLETEVEFLFEKFVAGGNC